MEYSDVVALFVNRTKSGLPGRDRISPLIVLALCPSDLAESVLLQLGLEAIAVDRREKTLLARLRNLKLGGNGGTEDIDGARTYSALVSIFCSGLMGIQSCTVAISVVLPPSPGLTNTAVILDLSKIRLIL
jgi:hypothetical protein